MGVNLRGIANTGCGQTERLHSPGKIFGASRAAQRQTLAQSRLVDLNDANPRSFQIDHFVAQRQSDLPADLIWSDRVNPAESMGLFLYLSLFLLSPRTERAAAWADLNDD